MNFAPIINLNERNPEALRAFFNTMPCFAGSGGRIDRISDDLKEVVVTVPLNEKTRNVVGTIYGGSMYAASDALYLILLWYQLGPEYFLLDRSSKVEYKRPGVGDVSARCLISDKELLEIKAALEDRLSYTRSYVVEFVDAADKLCCRIEKEVYIRKINGQEAKRGKLG